MSDGELDRFMDAVKEAAQWHRRTRTEQAEFDRASAGAFPGGPTLKAGDWVLHPEAGRCCVIKIEEAIVHLLPEDGAAVEVSLNTTVFAPDSIESGGVRIFSMTP